MDTCCVSLRRLFGFYDYFLSWSRGRFPWSSCSDDHGDSAVAVFSGGRCPCCAGRVPALCVHLARVGRFQPRVPRCVWLSQQAGCRLLASSCSWILTCRFRLQRLAHGQRLCFRRGVLHAHGGQLQFHPLCGVLARLRASPFSSLRAVSNDSVPALLSLVTQLPTSIAIEQVDPRFALAWMSCGLRLGHGVLAVGHGAVGGTDAGRGRLFGALCTGTGPGGHVHRDMTPIIRCIRALVSTKTLLLHLVRTTTTTTTLRGHFGSSETSCRSFYLRRSQGNHRKGTLQ